MSHKGRRGKESGIHLGIRVVCFHLLDSSPVFPAAPRRAGQAALAYGQGSAGADPAGEQGAYGEVGGLLDGGSEPVPGGGRAP